MSEHIQTPPNSRYSLNDKNILIHPCYPSKQELATIQRGEEMLFPDYLIHTCTLYFYCLLPSKSRSQPITTNSTRVNDKRSQYWPWWLCAHGLLAGTTGPTRNVHKHINILLSTKVRRVLRPQPLGFAGLFCRHK